MSGPEGKPPATWRPLILWSAAIVLVLALAWFVGAVAVPAYQVHKVIRTSNMFWLNWSPRTMSSGSVKDLGGPDQAARKISIYLHLPKWLTCRGQNPPYLLGAVDNRYWAIALLEACGKPGVPPLVRELKRPEPYIRKLAAESLGRIGPEARKAVPALIEALADNENGDEGYGHVPPPSVCCVAAEALGKIGPDAEAALPALEKLRDGDFAAREAAAAAIAKIRGKRPE